MIEYKRILVNVDQFRLEQLSSQMKWRLNEGDGMAIYYLGVDDNGSPYMMSIEEKKETLKNFNILLQMNSATIIRFEVMKSDKINFFKLTIKKKSHILSEKRVLLLGPSKSGKSTFLAKFLYNKIDNANMYISNHKHEMESGMTSSIIYHYYTDIISNEKIKYIFVEAPGNDKYMKTKYKALLGFKPDVILLFGNNKYDLFLCNTLFPNNYIIMNNCNFDIDKIKNFKLDIKSSKTIKFNIMNIYPEKDNTMIVAGLLETGKLEINKQYNWLFKNKIIRGKIKSIHQDVAIAPQILSICLQKIWQSRNLCVGETKSLQGQQQKPYTETNYYFVSFNNMVIENKQYIGYTYIQPIILTNIKHIYNNVYSISIFNKIHNYDIIIIPNIGILKEFL